LAAVALPIQQRVDFKLGTVTFRAIHTLHTGVPSYLASEMHRHQPSCIGVTPHLTFTDIQSRLRLSGTTSLLLIIIIIIIIIYSFNKSVAKRN